MRIRRRRRKRRRMNQAEIQIGEKEVSFSD